MVIGIDASRANSRKKTGVEWYAFHVIQGLKKVVNNDVHVVLYSREPLVGELAVLPKSWSSRVLSWKPGCLWTQIRLGWEMIRHSPDVLFVPAHVPPLIHPKKTAGGKSTGQFVSWFSVREPRTGTGYPILLCPSADSGDRLGFRVRRRRRASQQFCHG